MIPGEVVFHPEYPYSSGITKELSVYQDAFVQDAIAELSIKPDQLVVDIGSNDGTLLSGFKQRGIRILGVEPTNIANIAREQGIETLQAFFDEDTARKIVETHGHAKLATATNVFAHVSKLGSFIRGLEQLLAPDGVFILENHYLLDVIEVVNSTPSIMSICGPILSSRSSSCSSFTTSPASMRAA